MSLHDFIGKIKSRFGLAGAGESEMIEFDEDGEVYPALATVRRLGLLFQKLFLSAVIILLALLSFGLGRLSVVGNREPIKIEYDPALLEPALSASHQSSGSTAGERVVVSKNGSRYHYQYCASAKQIREENKIFFATAAAAEAAGYALASNCKPR